jgi:pilus assembly protein CpaC
LISVDPAIGALSYLLSGRKGQLLEVDAQKRDQLVKILAEPTIVAVSGKPGSFVSGGKVYLPVPAVSGSSPTLQETEFGIRLNFLPTVLDNGRINLKVEPEVSEPISFQTNLAFSLRKVSSTVELKDGETLVIGGLLKNNVEEAISRLPILGDIPILGALFRSSEFKNNRSELVVVVSPSLVKATTSMPTLPTDNFVPPTRSEFFLEGKMEGSATQSEGSNADR